VPLSRDRDNVNPSYLRKVRTGVLNVNYEELTSEDVGATWVRDAVGSSKSSDQAVQHVMETRFGENHVTRSVSDIGSANEAVCQGYKVVEGGSMSKEEWARYKAIKGKDGESVVKTSAQLFPTNAGGFIREDEIVPSSEWTTAMSYFGRLVGFIGPRLIGKPVVVQYINDEDNHIEGCFSKGYRGNRSKKGFKRVFGVMTVNLAYCDPANLLEGYSLLLHELAHDKVESNDHLHHEFYDTVNDLGAKLAVLIQDEPKLFDIGTNSFGFTDVQPVWGATPDVSSEGSLVVLRNKAVADK
jgi:hypothetical protein